MLLSAHSEGTSRIARHVCHVCTGYHRFCNTSGRKRLGVAPIQPTRCGLRDGYDMLVIELAG
jgi:hypothetical protein